MEHDMKYLHTMLRVSNIEESLNFYCNMLGLKELRRYDDENGRYTLIFLSADQDADNTNPATIELTYNWDPQDYTEGRNFGHIAYAVDDIYALCAKLIEGGITINRPPRDGRMAFVRSPDNLSVELLQVGAALPIQEPWASMSNTGHW
jgi:lactoylglutathione lyase